MARQHYVNGELKDMTLEEEAAYNAFQIEATAAAQLTEDQIATQETDRMERFTFEILLNLENRARVLEGKSSVTRAQYRNALIAAYKAMPK